jgi:hypothetical protein
LIIIFAGLDQIFAASGTISKGTLSNVCHSKLAADQTHLMQTSIVPAMPAVPKANPATSAMTSLYMGALLA